MNKQAHTHANTDRRNECKQKHHIIAAKKRSTQRVTHKDSTDANAVHACCAVPRSETGAGFTQSSEQPCSHEDGKPLGVIPNAVQSVSQDTGDSTADERCFEAGVGPHAVPCTARSRQFGLQDLELRPLSGQDISQSSTANDLKLYHQHRCRQLP